MSNAITAIREALEQAASEIAVAGHSGWGNTCFDGAAAITELLARLDACEKDAARYRHLRDKSAGQWEHPIVVTQTRTQKSMAYFGPLAGELLDSAIDAAISAQPSGES